MINLSELENEETYYKPLSIGKFYNNYQLLIINIIYWIRNNGDRNKTLSIKEFESLLPRYQIGLEPSLNGCDFISLIMFSYCISNITK